MCIVHAVFRILSIVTEKEEKRCRCCIIAIANRRATIGGYIVQMV